MTAEMIQYQRGDLLRDLVGGVMAYTGKGDKVIVGGDEFAGALGRRPADRVVGIAPDEYRPR